MLTSNVLIRFIQPAHAQHGKFGFDRALQWGGLCEIREFLFIDFNRAIHV